MSEDYWLKAGMRLTRKREELSLPVFTKSHSNYMYMAQSDNRLLITAFLQFLNEYGYRLDFDLPAEVVQEPYKIGSEAPIVVYTEGRTLVVRASNVSNSMNDLRSSGASEALIANLLETAEIARAGRSEVVAATTKLEIALDNPDLNQVNHSKYWVDLFCQAVKEASYQPALGDAIVRGRLGDLAREWFTRYSLSASASILYRMFDVVDTNSVLAINDLAHIMQHTIISRFMREARLDPLPPTYTRLSDRFAAKYRQMSTRSESWVLPEYAAGSFSPISVIYDGTFVKQYTRLMYADDARNDFASSLAIARLAYVDADLPVEAQDRARYFAREREEKLREYYAEYSGRVISWHTTSLQAAAYDRDQFTPNDVRLSWARRHYRQLLNLARIRNVRDRFSQETPGLGLGTRIQDFYANLDSI
ncbi:hypothetical protein ACE7GA_09440 [Roseomonas sp. CCTCC AB2023176]|uniref:hypothetical protein n=1 Tax=Roseomonas sp. CCTCC AB2023176 TaxID=3342640 RepID=UPI0035DBED91